MSDLKSLFPVYESLSLISSNEDIFSTAGARILRGLRIGITGLSVQLQNKIRIKNP
jgi:hypothetical protein